MLKEKTMTLKQHNEKINKMQRRISELVDELRLTQNELRVFKQDVSRDIKRAFEKIEKK
tara:strand:- start:720 stop:896 length:177 start_codon:yes stop_codon:yes gene_type:complete